MDYENENGLVNGLIPAGAPCPFEDECPMLVQGRCPTKGNLREVNYSCAAARLWSLGRVAKNRKAG